MARTLVRAPSKRAVRLDKTAAELLDCLRHHLRITSIERFQFCTTAHHVVVMLQRNPFKRGTGGFAGNEGRQLLHLTHLFGAELADGLGQLGHRQCGTGETQNFRGVSSGAA